RQVIRTFPETDQLHRHPQLPLDGDHDAALGGAVELGEGDTGDIDDLTEDARLSHTVLPRRRVQDEEYLIDRSVLLDDALDLAELVHQPGLGLKPSGGVDDHDIRLLLD